jgi:Tfp pilus assembly protein PilO
MENTNKNNSKKKLADYLKVNLKEQANSLIVLLIIVCIALGYFVFLPAANGYKTNRINTENLNRQKAALEQKQVVLKGLDAEIKEKADFIAKTEDAMPKTAQVPEMLVTLSELSNNNSLYITNFLPKEVDSSQQVNTGTAKTPKIKYKTLNIEFDVSGNYINMKQFIKDMETNIRTININNISISGGGEISKETTTEILRFHVKADVYYKN